MLAITNALDGALHMVHMSTLADPEIEWMTPMQELVEKIKDAREHAAWLRAGAQASGGDTIV